jgi:hypothetical protein
LGNLKGFIGSVKTMKINLLDECLQYLDFINFNPDDNYQNLFGK